MEALVHDKPHKCGTYAKHCTKAFIRGTSTEHYRCWKFWTPTTRATRISGTAFFKHKYLTNPSVMPEDQVIAAAAHLMDTLQGIKSPHLHTSTLKLLGDLQDIFHEAAKSTQAQSQYNPCTHLQGCSPCQPPAIMHILLMTGIILQLTRKLKFGIKARKLRFGIKVRRRTDWSHSTLATQVIYEFLCTHSASLWTLQHPSPRPNPSADLNELQTWASSHPTLPLRIPLHATRAVKFKNAQSPKKPSLPA